MKQFNDTSNEGFCSPAKEAQIQLYFPTILIKPIFPECFLYIHFILKFFRESDEKKLTEDQHLYLQLCSEFILLRDFLLKIF